MGKPETTKTPTPTPTPVDDLRLPPGTMLIRRVSPPDGLNAFVGQTRRGWLHTVEVIVFARIEAHCPGEFEPARKVDREAFEAWLKDHQDDDGKERDKRPQS